MQRQQHPGTVPSGEATDGEIDEVDMLRLVAVEHESTTSGAHGMELTSTGPPLLDRRLGGDVRVVDH